MVASAVFILDLKGKVLISRNYRGDIPMPAIEKFMNLIIQGEEDEVTPTPLLSTEDGIHFLYIRHNNLYLVAMTKKNSNAAMILLFLHKLCSVFTDYFKELEEESIRDNFVIIYELLDEMMDFGYPQTTETKILQEYITQESYKLEKQVRPPMAVTNAVSWRSEGLKYRKNEVFLDVVESVNLVVNASGNVVRSEILGAIKMRCFLSGMPDVRLGLNDKLMFENTGRSNHLLIIGAGKGKAVEMEDVKFHQCVRLSRFENDRTISFIPPDGEFELMSYRLNTEVKPLIIAEVVVESHPGSRIEYMMKAKATFKRRSTANNVEIIVPVPEDADSPKFKTNMGNVEYAPDKGAFIWKIKSFAGGKEFLCRAHFGLPSVKNEDPDKKPPITIKFEIPYFTVSGIQVRYLKVVDKSGYQAFPWVRYITQNGVKAHNKNNDIWIIIKKKVYNVTEFLSQHPGGEEVLMDMAGKDATTEFEDIGHSNDALEDLKKLYIGDLA
ncbi:AP-1 complex subunit mu-1 [Boothiomyces macroporosus]|uniref:AP-1 complex subunit mu-1 n=1 Tax=Boothiomyces macroporosus TaxID=261099 RepID=A0AAD5UM52_9FUNG|nr:AP-1 complex subunit mu-1 [Boothiomyces macroporosus]